jgi:PPOX class probable F420-dependent enzyme
VDLTQGLEFARGRDQGVLVTIKRDGRPQLSNIIYVIGADGTVRISVTAPRAKARNLARDPRASLYVAGDDFWKWIVLEGDTTLTPVAAAPDDATVEDLVDLYRTLRGDHDNWDEYRATMVRDQRLVIHFTATHAYGMP